MELAFNPGPQFSKPLTEELLKNEKDKNFSDYIQFQINGLKLIRETLPRRLKSSSPERAAHAVRHFLTSHPWVGPCHPLPRRAQT